MTKVDKSGHPTQHKVVKVEGYLGLKKVEMEEAGVGDIVSFRNPRNHDRRHPMRPNHIVRLLPLKSPNPPFLSR